MARRTPAAQPVILTKQDTALIKKIVNDGGDGCDGTLGSTAWIAPLLGGKTREAVFGSLEQKGVIEILDNKDKGAVKDLYLAFPETARPIIETAVRAGNLPASILETSDAAADEDEEDEDDDEEDDDEEEDTEDEEDEDDDEEDDDEEEEEEEPAPAPAKKGKTVTAAAPATTPVKGKKTTPAPTPAPASGKTTKVAEKAAPAPAAGKKKTSSAGPRVEVGEDGKKVYYNADGTVMNFATKMAFIKSEKAAGRILPSAPKEKTPKKAKEPRIRNGEDDELPIARTVATLSHIALRARWAQENYRKGDTRFSEERAENARQDLLDFLKKNRKNLGF